MKQHIKISSIQLFVYPVITSPSAPYHPKVPKKQDLGSVPTIL